MTYPTSFVAIDVETANTSPGSICQLGAAFFRDGELVDTYSTLVDPKCEFGYFQQQVHGLDLAKVRGAPLWADVGAELLERCSGLLIASHSMFDRNAIRTANTEAGLIEPPNPWLNTINVVRRAWPDRFAKGSSGLKVVASHFGIAFEHHDALEDAIAAGKVLLEACRATGITPHGWIQRCNEPIHPRPERRVAAPC